ncbi:hypothetical protein MN116_003206 [Schistosoma mekongi]|uniref:Carrier domain-containing protein n=1 Tax=Schistosoma mekongi TaxID=38744 RepID=A0AAE2D7E6_SCHME|nr:hypothetical protein MN116_003206 [Schistosoma mekongi]
MPQSTVQLKSPLLHTLLENLTQSSICSSTAIWHVPNPVNFICQQNENSLGNNHTLINTTTNVEVNGSNKNNDDDFHKKLQDNQEKKQIYNDEEQHKQKSLGEFNSNKSSLNQEPNEIYTMTFLELNNAANRLAMNLANYLERKWSSITNKINRTQLNQHSSLTDQPIEHRNQSDTLIALFMPPGIDRIVAQIACMKLHLAYMPLDRNVPAGRISQILMKLKPILILIAKDYYDFMYDAETDEKHNDQLSTNENDKILLTKKFSSNDFIVGNLNELINAFQSFDIKVYEYIKLMKLSKYYSKSDIYTASIPIRFCLFPFESDPVVLVLFTSGSTSSGPKSVKLKTIQLFNRLEWQWNSASDMDLPNFEDTTSNSNISLKRIGLAKTAWGFVDAFTELFSCLLAGIPVVVPGSSICPSEKSVTDVQQLINLTKYFQITHITTVPAQLNLWLRQLRLKPKEIVTCSLSSLRSVIVSGDIVHPKMACEFFQLFSKSEIRLINLYGTTEVAGDVTGLVFHNELDVKKHTKVVPYGSERENNESGKPVLSVGTPIQGTAIFIVENDDDHHQYNNDDENQLDSWSDPSLSIVGSVERKLNLEQFPYKLMPKGHIGQVCILGQQVSEGAVDCHYIESVSDNLNHADTNIYETENGFDSINEEFRRDKNLTKISIFMPGDLGFIDPQTNHLYICGRTNELIKVNGIRFHASDIDNLFNELKKKWRSKNMNNCSREELLVNKVSETVTLTIQTVHGRDLKLVCFYVLHMNENRSTMNIEPNDNHENIDLPKNDDFMAVLSHYLPQYLSPTFINIDHIPLMRTSGKVDKEYLRQYYYSKHHCEISDITKVLQAGWINDSVKPITDNNNNTSDQLLGKCSRNFKLSRSRERARKVLAEVLGLRSSNGDVIPDRPKDDEDFYLLGGDSLLTVLATEQLRQLGFNVNLDVFTKTGKIGSILTNLQNTESDFLKTQEPLTSDSWTVNDIVLNKILKKSYTCNLINRIPLMEDEWYLSSTNCFHGSYEIFIEQWNDGNFNITERHEIIDVLVNAFIEKDRLSHALKLDRTDLTEVIESYLNVHKYNPGIVLTARYYYKNPHEYTFVKNKLVGVLISLPAKHVPSRYHSPKLALIQRFFDECCKEDQYQDIPLDKLLSTQVVAITSQSPYSNSKYLQYMLSNWKKISLKLLARLERDLLRIAAKQGYAAVITLNTSEVTEEVCSQLGYKTIKTTMLKSFMNNENKILSPQYERMHCSYMIKDLIHPPK